MEDHNQFSLFDFDDASGSDETTANEQKDNSCPFKAEKAKWWSSRNTHLCSKTYDCSHCHIEHPIELTSNPIRKRGKCSVFYCKRVKSSYENGVFKSKCEITGNEWESKAWSMHEDYNTHPINSPCTFCDLPACENCVFYKDVSEKNPYGCCGGCAHRMYCPSSKYDKSEPISVDEFLGIAIDKKELDGTVADFTKGAQKKSYQSSCPYFNGYLCNGSHSQTLCKEIEQPIKSEIYRSICETNHEICPIFKRKEKL